MALRDRGNKRSEPLVYESLEDLLAILEEERRKSLKRRKLVTIGLGIYVFVMLLFMAAVIVFHVHFTAMGAMFSWIGVATATAFAASQKQQKAAEELAKFSDVRMVPRLIEMLDYNDKGMRANVVTLLLALLPQLRASDASLLTQEHHATLNRVLTSRFQSDKGQLQQLRLDILQAMQQIGDESSLPIVQQLADGKGSAQRSAVLRQAAQECLPFLQQRAEHQRATQTLLRAADGNTTPLDVLLRPAMPTHTDTRSDELLRVVPVESSGQAPPASVEFVPPAQSAGVSAPSAVPVQDQTLTQRPL